MSLSRSTPTRWASILAPHRRHPSVTIHDDGSATLHIPSVRQLGRIRELIDRDVTLYGLAYRIDQAIGTTADESEE